MIGVDVDMGGEHARGIRDLRSGRAPLLGGTRLWIVGARHRLNKYWEQLWREPDRFLVGEGAKGELKVVKVRLVLVLVLIIIPFSEINLDARGAQCAGLAAIMVAGLMGLVVSRIASSNRYTPAVGFVTSIMDVTMVSAVLLAFLLIDRPLLVANSKVLFSAYFVAIAGTTLRHDPRVCAMAGLLATAQYAFLVAFADARFLLHRPDFLYAQDGTFDVNSHYARLILMVTATALATSAARQARRLREVSARDPLTGVMNRGFFDELADAESRRTLRYKRDLTIALLDVDYFKQFNDKYGHLVGDEILRGIGQILQGVRKSDLVARYGGEEFIILFPETTLDTVLQKLEDLRKRVEAAGVTVSIGAASMPDDGTEIRTVIDTADRRLYEAKRAGRNRVVGPDGVVGQRVPADAVAP